MIRMLQRKLYLLIESLCKNLSISKMLQYKKTITPLMTSILLRGVYSIRKSFLFGIISSWIQKIKRHCKTPLINYILYDQQAPDLKNDLATERQMCRNNSGFDFHNLDQKHELRGKLQRRTHSPSMPLSINTKATAEQQQLLQAWSKQQQKGFFRPAAVINIYLSPRQIDSISAKENSPYAVNMHNLVNNICKHHRGKITINIIIDQLYLLDSCRLHLQNDEKTLITSYDFKLNYHNDSKHNPPAHQEITENLNNKLEVSLEQIQTKIISEKYNPEKTQTIASFFFELKQTINTACKQLTMLVEDGLASTNNITCAITINWQQLTNSKSETETYALTGADSGYIQILEKIKQHVISLRITNIKHVLSRYFRRAGYIILIIILFYSHSYGQQMQRQRNWLYRHALSISQQKTNATINWKLSDIKDLNPQPMPQALAKLWWFSNDNLSWEHYNMHAKKVARRLLTHILTETYKEKLEQQHHQFNDKNKSLAQFASTVDNYITYQQLINPLCLRQKTYDSAIINFINQQQSSVDSNTTKPHKGDKEVSSMTNWLWPKVCVNSTGIDLMLASLKNQKAPPSSNNNNMQTQLETRLSLRVKTDILSPTWNSNALLNSATNRLGAIALVYYMNQQKLFQRTLSLSQVAANTSIHSNYLLRGFNSPWFYKKNILSQLSSPEPIINIASKYNPHHISIYKLNNNFYKIQFHQDWINFVNSWELNYSNSASNSTSNSAGNSASNSAGNSAATNNRNLNWLSDIAAPDNDFSRAVLLAKNEISPTSSFIIGIATQKHLTDSLINKITKKIGLKSSEKNNSNNAVKQAPSFSQLLAQYRGELSSLYSKLQPILSNQQCGQLSLDYVKRILNNIGKDAANYPLLQSVATINKMLDKISDPQAKSSMRHLLMQPLLITWNIIDNNACDELEKIWQQQIQQQFSKQLATYYPCNPHSNSDADPTLMQQLLFTNNQGLALFLKHNIKPLIKHDVISGEPKTPWVEANNGPFRLSLNRKSLQQLEDVQQLLEAMVLNQNSTSFYLHFALTAVPNPSIDSLSIQLSKKVFKYNNGPLHWEYYQSDLPYTMRQASIHITTTDGARILVEHATGPFAPLRILASANWGCLANSIECKLSWELNNRKKQQIRIIMRGANIKYYRELVKLGIKLPRQIINHAP